MLDKTVKKLLHNDKFHGKYTENTSIQLMTTNETIQRHGKSVGRNTS